MNNSQIQPYLCFNGNCEEAMKFYQSVLGGSLDISRFGEFTPKEVPLSDEQKNGVMHSTLKSDTFSFMASDGMPGTPVVFGNSISMSMAGTDTEQLTMFFNGLSEGGVVTIPLAKQVWGDQFGMFEDKYGIRWMINITADKPAQ